MNDNIKELWERDRMLKEQEDSPAFVRLCALLKAQSILRAELIHHEHNKQVRATLEGDTDTLSDTIFTIMHETCQANGITDFDTSLVDYLTKEGCYLENMGLLGFVKS